MISGPIQRFTREEERVDHKPIILYRRLDWASARHFRARTSTFYYFLRHGLNTFLSSSWYFPLIRAATNTRISGRACYRYVYFYHLRRNRPQRLSILHWTDSYHGPGSVIADISAAMDEKIATFMFLNG
jgi:hypothetical protein